MNKLLKKKKKDKKSTKTTKSSKTTKGTKKKKTGGKKKTNLFKDEKPKEEKKVSNDAWGDEEEDEGFIIDYKVKEKKTNENDRPAPVNLENGWKEEEVVIEIKKKEEEPKEQKPKKIQWGDSLKKDTNYEQTIADNYFPELGDESAKKKKKAQPKKTEEGSSTGSFFNSSLKNPSDNLKRLMAPGPGATTTSNGITSSTIKPVQIGSLMRSNIKSEPLDTGPMTVKGKISLKYEKTDAEKAREKMMAEVEERKRRLKEEAEKRKAGTGMFGRGTGTLVRRQDDKPRGMLQRGNMKSQTLTRGTMPTGTLTRGPAKPVETTGTLIKGQAKGNGFKRDDDFFADMKRGNDTKARGFGGGGFNRGGDNGFSSGNTGKGRGRGLIGVATTSGSTWN